jgi:hypothetical protein
MQAWIPVVPDRIVAGETIELRGQLAEFSSAVHDLGSGEFSGFVADRRRVGFLSGLGDALGDGRGGRSGRRRRARDHSRRVRSAS